MRRGRLGAPGKVMPRDCLFVSRSTLMRLKLLASCPMAGRLSCSLQRATVVGYRRPWMASGSSQDSRASVSRRVAPSKIQVSVGDQSASYWLRTGGHRGTLSFYRRKLECIQVLSYEPNVRYPMALGPSPVLLIPCWILSGTLLILTFIIYYCDFRLSVCVASGTRWSLKHR